jgi:DNA-binding NtrC family response regulator
MEAHSRRIIEQALLDADGNQTKAAERLRLQRTYLARLLRQQRQKPSDKTDEADERVTESAGKV